MKKLFTTFLCLCIMISVLGFSAVSVFADSDFSFTVSISSKNEQGAIAASEGKFTGKTLKADITVTSGDDTGVTYKYEWGDKGSGIYTSESSDEYIPGNDFIAWKTAYVKVTAYNSEGKELATASATQYMDSIGRVSHRYANLNGPGFSSPTSDTSIYNDTDEKSVFVIDGKRFIMLDVFSNEDEMYYIMADDTYGSRQFDTGKKDNGDKTLFKTSDADPNQSSGEGNIAYWLNNEFISEEYTGEKLPQDIIDHLVPHTYQVPQNIWYGSNTETVKVALLGRIDYIKYMDKFSAVVNGNINDSWWLRDTEGCGGNDSKYGPFYVAPSYNIVEGSKGLKSSAYIRPVFYLGKDFFESVKLDLTQVGDTIKKVLTDKYDINTLIDMYGLQELAEAGMINMPEAENISFSGKASEGNTIECSYEFRHEGGLDELDSEYGFEMSSDRESGFEKVAQNTYEYKVPSGSKDKYIRFFVTPKDTLGVSGNTQYSAAVKIGARQEIVIDAADINDENGNIIESLEQAKQIRPQLTLKNSTEKELKAIVLCAVYDEDDKMLANMAESVLIPGGGEITAQGIVLENPEYKTGNYAKIIVWDSLLTMNSFYSAEIR